MCVGVCVCQCVSLCVCVSVCVCVCVCVFIWFIMNSRLHTGTLMASLTAPNIVRLFSHREVNVDRCVWVCVCVFLVFVRLCVYVRVSAMSSHHSRGIAHLFELDLAQGGT